MVNQWIKRTERGLHRLFVHPLETHRAHNGTKVICCFVDSTTATKLEDHAISTVGVVKTCQIWCFRNTTL